MLTDDHLWDAAPRLDVRLELKHTKGPGQRPRCNWCDKPWPCTIIRLVDAYCTSVRQTGTKGEGSLKWPT